MLRPGLVAATHVLAFWPVWRWYASRVTDGSDEPWGIAALAAALALTWPCGRTMKGEHGDRLLIAAAGLTFIYAALAPLAPPLVRAVLAMAALACSWVSIAGARGKLPAIVALFALSLPVIASLQFYAGYPLRIVTAAGATGLLNLSGFDIERAGTAMIWQGQTVLVDAPCSGIRMLWAAAVLACVLALQRDAITWRAMAALLGMVLPVALLANTLRAAALFIIETRAEPAAEWLHSFTGIATFAAAGGLMLLIESSLRPSLRAVAK